MNERSPQSRPRLLVLCTGGTIAGAGASSCDLETYSAGVHSGEQLLAALPEARAVAALTVEQIANIDSADMSHALWFRLLQRIDAAFSADPDLTGVVITHGTNTLEETAWLLHLLIDDPRPVVLVGAMRPASALSADGPLNLFQAVQVASSAEARGRGVMVVMDGQIHSARAVSKRATQGVGAFHSAGRGPLGWVDDFGVHLPEVERSAPAAFVGLSLPTVWPQVVILHGCVQPSEALIPALLSAGVEGLVFTGTGAGQLSAVERNALAQWQGPLPLMLRANRCGMGPVHRCEDHARLGLLPAGDLSPQKARVLLLLALINGDDRNALASRLMAVQAP